ncbi:MAG: hypothetical protein HQ522_22070 [Bacteroidetes bacterium]|nr:hypothetical protein [Bacteroidota bacterium]
MKLLLLYFVIFISMSSYSQENEFLLSGRIVGPDARPIADAYIINNKNLQINISNTNGNFNVWVKPGDSLIISHISYKRRKIYAANLLNNSTIYLTPLTRDILEVNVSPDYKSNYELARNNISFISELKVIPFMKIKEETDPVLEMAIENNRIMRSEAASVSLLRFPFTQQIIDSKKNIQQRKEWKQYSSSQKIK